MEEKLKLALKKIHWSLAFKAVIAGLSWVYFPWWFSLFVLLGIYFIPLFQTRNLFLPFLTTLVLGWILPGNLFSGVLIALQIYLILGVKDFIFIDREAAMRILAVLFLAETGTIVYSRPENWLLGAFLSGVLFGLVYYFSSYKVLDVSSRGIKKGDKPVMLIFSFLLVQFAFALNFLPISMLYKSLLLILVSIIFFEWQKLIFSHELTKNRILLYGMLFFGLVVLIFSGSTWGL